MSDDVISIMEVSHCSCQNCKCRDCPEIWQDWFTEKKKKKLLDQQKRKLVPLNTFQSNCVKGAVLWSFSYFHLVLLGLVEAVFLSVPHYGDMIQAYSQQQEVF